jgi:hypothetical protein
MADMLSKHFSADEFRCPSSGECKMQASSLIAFEEFRSQVSKFLGKDTPLKILSGYRDPAHNAEIGGAERSQHTYGRAADVALPKGLSLADAYRIADGIPAFKAGGVGVYPDDGFIHLDDRGVRARWARVGGKGGTPQKYVGIEVVLAALKQKGKA